MAQLKVLSSGFHTTIQDQGRTKCQQLGLAEAGAIDKQAFFWGNKLLGNHPECPSLEILVGNTEFQFESPSYIALSGADMQARLNGQAIENWKASPVKSGDKLSLNFVSTGLRAYLSIVGGFKDIKFFSSSSTVEREETGGNQGSKIQEGDILHYTAINEKKIEHKVPLNWQEDYSKELLIRFMPGYHFEEFNKKSIQSFLNTEYSISNDADRMGYRLSGAKLQRENKDILSIGVPCGAIQIPSAGEPIILLNDRQCTGGYPILGVIAQRDIYRLSQRKSGDKLRFQKVEIKELEKESQDFYKFFYGEMKI